MTKRDQMNANYAVADALLGRHTGASKGTRPPPKATFKVRPVGGIKNITKGPQGFKAEWKTTF
jgi:hypothetical protein